MKPRKRAKPDTSQLIRLPWKFWEDHRERELPTPEDVPPSNKRNLWVRRDDPALPELLSDARYYADPHGPDGFACGPDDREGQLWGMRLKRSAKLTAEAIEAAFGIKRTEYIPTTPQNERIQNMELTTTPNIFAPKYPDQWTAADEDAACAEGWAISERDDRGILEIERIDCNDPPHENAPKFEYDDDAIEHVRIRAAHGSELHARALDIHRRYLATWMPVQVSATSGSGQEVEFFVMEDDEDPDDPQSLRKTISRDEAFLVLEQLKDALGNPAPIMGRLWWRADDLEELVSHVDQVAKAGGRILSIDPSPVDISYIFEIDRATADKALGYHVEDDEWLIPDYYAVYCIDDDGKYIRATKCQFPDQVAAQKYADTIARSRQACVRPVYEAEPVTSRAELIGAVVRTAQELLDAFGGNTPDWVRAEAEALAASIGRLLSPDGQGARE